MSSENPKTPSAGELRRERSSATRNTTLLFATQVIASVIALFNSVVMFRVMGASDRGELAFLTVIANMASAIALFGIDVSHGNLLGQKPERARTVATNSWVLGLLLGIGAGLLLCILFVIFPQIEPDAPLGLIAAAILVVPFMVVMFALRALAITEYHFGLASLAVILMAGLNIAGNIAFAVIGTLTVDAALFTWIAGQLAALFVLAVWVGKEIGYGRPDFRLIRGALSFGAKNHLTTSMQLANFRIDQWFVGVLAGNAQLGIYVNAVAFAETLFYLPQAVASAQRPDLIRAKHEDAAHTAATGARLAAIVSAIGAAALIVFAPLLMNVFFGEEGKDGIPMLQWLAPGAIGIAMTKILSSALSSQNRPLPSAIPILLGLVATVGLDLLLIPDHGGVGAAVASTVAYMVSGVAMIVAFNRVFGTSFKDFLPGRSDARALNDTVRGLRARFQGS